MKNEKVQFMGEQKKYLTDFISKGKRGARAIRRANMLLLLDQSTTEQKNIAFQLGCSQNTITNTIKRYHQCSRNAEQALLEKPRSAQPPKVTPAIEAYITALACAKEGPDGHSRWTLRLIADNLVEMGHADSITHETVRQVLKKAVLSPGRRSCGALAK